MISSIFLNDGYLTRVRVNLLPDFRVDVHSPLTLLRIMPRQSRLIKPRVVEQPWPSANIFSDFYSMIFGAHEIRKYNMLLKRCGAACRITVVIICKSGKKLTNSHLIFNESLICKFQRKHTSCHEELTADTWQFTSIFIKHSPRRTKVLAQGPGNEYRRRDQPITDSRSHHVTSY